MRDFNATEFVTEISVGTTRLEEGIQIYDDSINEAQEVFEVNLTVEGNFTVMYRIRTAVCRIPESDRKWSCTFIMLCTLVLRIEVLHTLSGVLLSS